MMVAGRQMLEKSHQVRVVQSDLAKEASLLSSAATLL